MLVKNDTPFVLIWKNFEGNHAEDDCVGMEDKIKPYSSDWVRIAPKSGFLGIECGVSGTADICIEGCRQFKVHVSWNIPAVGDDSFYVYSSHAKLFQARSTYRGKNGNYNPHNYTISVSPDPQVVQKMTMSDAGLEFFKQVGLQFTGTALSTAAKMLSN